MSVLAIDAALAVVFVNQGEGGAGYLVRIGGVEGLRDSLHQGGLAGAQVSAKKEQSGRGKQVGDFSADRDGLPAAVADESPNGHSPLLQHAWDPLQPNIPSLVLGAKAKCFKKMRTVSMASRVCCPANGRQSRRPVREERRLLPRPPQAARGIGQHGRDDAGQDVTAPAFGHSWIAGGVDGDAAVGMGDERAPPF